MEPSQNLPQKQNRYREQMQINSTESLKAISELELKADASLFDIRKLETPPISALVKSGNKAECYQLIKLIIVSINQFLGITWSDYQMIETAKEFYSRYFYWHQLDLKKFMSMCRNMEFEKLLSVNQFSPIMFLEWSARYDSMWVNVSEELMGHDHDRHKYDADRESEIYKREVRLRIDKEQDQDRMERMSGIIERQNDQLQQLRDNPQ